VDWFDDWALTWAVFVPLAGALVLALVPATADRLARMAGVGVTFLALLAGVGMLARFDLHAGRVMQFEVNRPWIETIGTRYHLGVDGIAIGTRQLARGLRYLQSGQAQWYAAALFIGVVGLAVVVTQVIGR
jgi:NADH:ubiquinone oxidoreductase subunit 4 (subunit M)